MDELIYILIKLIAELFGGGQSTPKGPGFPNLPPRMPGQAPPQQQPGMQQRTTLQQRAGQAMQRMGQGNPPAVRRRAAAPAAVAAAPKVAPVQAPVAAALPPPPRAVQPAHSAGVDAAALRRWLRPQVLHSQFVLSEIFQPPLALRPPRDVM